MSEAPTPGSDPWLQRWLPLLREQAGDGPVLELGCGRGRDSRTLAEAGLRVLGLDLSAEDIDHARRAVPQAAFHVGDLRAAWPTGPAPLGAIVASLSLHYFAWDETEALAHRLHQALRPGGVLLCRLNSTRDRHFGAEGHPRIAEHYHLVDGVPKRFFDRAAVQALFGDGWQTLSLEERVIDRYAQPKVVWELVARRVERAGAQ